MNLANVITSNTDNQDHVVVKALKKLSLNANEDDCNQDLIGNVQLYFLNSLGDENAKSRLSESCSYMANLATSNRRVLSI